MPHTEAETLERVLLLPLISPLPFFLEPVFTKLLSHTQIVINVTNDLYVAKFNGRFKVLVLLDLSAALDGVDPFILIETCASLGYQITTLTWFSFHLTADPILLVPPHLLAWNSPWDQHKLSIYSTPFVISAEFLALIASICQEFPNTHLQPEPQNARTYWVPLLRHLLLEVSDVAHPKLSSWSSPANPYCSVLISVNHNSIPPVAQAKNPGWSHCLLLFTLHIQTTSKSHQFWDVSNYIST